MTKTKKVVAIMLALLMMFSSFSVLATAWDATTDDGSALTIATKFFKEVDGEWVETTKVRPNDTVKARVYLGTDYYSNDSTLLFFYDKDFFTLSSTGALAVNNSGFATANGITASYNANPNVNSQVAKGYIDAAFLNDYSAVTANVHTESGENDSNIMYDNSDWLLEFTMTVNADASGEGDFFVKDTTVQSTTNDRGIVNVPKGPADGNDMDIWAMWLWDADVSLSSQPVTTISSVTFNANGGAYGDGTALKVIEDEIDAKIAADAVPVPELEGYTFMGWVDATDADPTLDEAAPAPEAIPENDLVLNAFWLKNVNITFDTDGGSAIAPIENVTPYTDFADVADPTKEGYTFVGWDVRGGDLPETYPDVDTTYTAIWALNVVVSFDTLGGTEIADVEGYEGDEFKAVIPNPTKEGHRFVKWDKELPTVFPEQDTTYTAIFESLTYVVTYIIEGEEPYEIELEYGAEIPTSLILAELPEGTEIKNWYTDAGYSNALAEGATMGAAPMTLYAKAENKTYNAIFMVDGEEYAVVPTVYGEFIQTPANPSKVGYEFAGWEPYPFEMEAKDMVFNASWVESEVNLKYWLDDSMSSDSVWYDGVIAYGEEIDIPAEPYKEGYDFIGWSKTPDGEVIKLEGMTMPAEALEFYAIFDVQKHKIIFNTDGGTEIETIRGDFGAEVIAPENPKKTGYTFAGWIDEKGNPTEVPATMPAEDITLKATWTINQYTITFNTDGGSAVAPITQDYATAVTAPEDPTKTGYTFAGWDAEIPATMPAENVTINAQWTVNQYTITFNTDGGSEIAPITQDYATDVTAPENPTKTGYTFAGWDVEVPATMPAENVTITAKWTINQYTITFDTVGGTEVAPITQDYNTAVTAPAAPTKTGYTFAGWDVAVPATMPAEDMTITAQWTINQYTITFDTVGGTAVAPITQDYNTAVTAPAAPTKTGYTFAGWDVEVPATMPAENVTITAQWTANQYTITFDVDGGTDVAPITQDFGTAITAPAAPTKAGYSFAGWSPELPATMPAENITVKAQWTALDGIAYTVEIYKMNTEGNFDGVVPEIINKADKAGVTVNYAPETITGFTFDAANADNVLEGVVAGDGSLVLKAYYSRNKVNVTINGKEEEYFYGEQITTPETPKAEEGYEFDKWVDENGDEVNFPITVPAEDIVITPVYNPLKYTTTWIAEGTQVAEFEVTYGEAVTAPEAPAKEGYRFVKWSPDVPATMPAKDMEFTAIYEVMSGYIVEYYVEGKLVESFSYMYGDTFVEYDYEAPMGYDFDGWYADAECSTEFDAPATVTAEFTKIYGKLVAKTFNATFNANGGQFADGSTSIDVLTVFDEQIVAPAAPTREGYVFAGWDNEVGLMDEEGKIFNASWIADSSLTATYIVDGDEENPYAVYEVAYGEDLDVPADPEKDGWEFLGWAETIDGEVVDLVGAKMPATSVKYYAIFKQSVAELVIYKYEDSQFGPAATPAPGFVVMDSAMINIGSPVVLPSDEEMDILDNYIFTGWVVKGTEDAVPETMPATGLEVVPTYEYIKAKLVPAAGSTTVLERTLDVNGRTVVKESYNDNSVTTDIITPASEECWNQYYIYGLKTGLGQKNLDVDDATGTISTYIDIQGYGKTIVTPVSGQRRLGTGTKVEVYDYVTGEIVETFYVVIFGDLDGNATINTADRAQLIEETANPNWTLKASRIYYKYKAANIDGNRTVNTADRSLLIEVTAGEKKIDQITGKAS